MSYFSFLISIIHRDRGSRGYIYSQITVFQIKSFQYVTELWPFSLNCYHLKLIIIHGYYLSTGHTAILPINFHL